MPGPMPKRSDERRRRNTDGIETIKVDVDSLVGQDVEIPLPPTKLVDIKDENDEPTGEQEEVAQWHPVALDAYWSLARSGQVIFMEPSDWATAYALCEMLSRELKPKPMLVTDADGATSIDWVYQPVNGSVMNAFLKGWASLMATEGDRRKLRIELERKKRADAVAGGEGKVVDIVQHRQDAFQRGARG